MRWQLKCLVDTAKAMLPFEQRLRKAKYRVFRYEEKLGRESWTIKQGLQQIDWIRSVKSLESATVLEVGSGWQPIIPILFSLAGAGRVLLTDTTRLCIPATVDAALRSIRAHKSLIIDSLGISGAVFDQGVAQNSSQDIDRAFGRLRLKYLAPCDCQKLDLPTASVDVLVSRAVLEHIPPVVLENIFGESFRILKPGGLVCHFIDDSDHWEFEDKSISRVNFLRYSDSVFRWTCLNKQNYQNRLRHPEYLQMMFKAGFSILREERKVDAKALAALHDLPIGQRFQSFSKEDLATIDSYVLARKPLEAQPMHS